MCNEQSITEWYVQVCFVDSLISLCRVASSDSTSQRIFTAFEHKKIGKNSMKNKSKKEALASGVEDKRTK